MAASSHPRVAFPYFKLRICLFLCLIGIASASDSASDLASAAATNLASVDPAGKLSPYSYTVRCPLAQITIKRAVTKAVLEEPRMGASLIRLHFHDCFVQGCDASVLLKDTATFKGEQSAFPNVNSLRGFDLIENIKSEIEDICPGVVSCADILAYAARDSVVALGGRGWGVRVGRRDSTTASLSAANSDLPSPSLDLNGLIAAFKKKYFTVKEMVALSGAHTIGLSRCSVFRDRIYNESNIDPWYAKSLQAYCPRTGGDDNLSPLDTTTPYIFDSAYYKNLLYKKGLLHSDQELFNGGSTDSIVKDYASNPLLFSLDFANAMLKMGNLSPLTGYNGQIRKQCSRVN